MRRIFMAAALLALAVPVHAQQGNLSATLDRDAQGLHVTIGTGGGLHDALTAQTVLLTLACNATVDCTVVRLATRVDSKEVFNWTAVGTATAAQARFQAPGATFSRTAEANFLLVTVPPDGPKLVLLENGDDARVDSMPALQDLVGDSLYACTYDVLAEARDSGEVVWEVSPVGRLLRRSAPEIREDQPLVVFIRGPRSVVSRMWAVRTSDFRTIGDFAVPGSDESVSTGVLRTSGTTGADSCGMTRSLVENFRGGAKGEFALMLAGRAGASADTFVTHTFGKGDLPVHRVYQGALSMGVVRTELRDPTYVLGARDSVLIETGASRRYLFTIFFTPYISRRRDVEHWRVRELLSYVNPTVGLTVNDVTHNALGGATVELPGGLFVSAGYHAGRVTRLVPGALAVGSVVHGGLSQVQTEQRWAVKSFYSLSIDIRAAALLLGKVAGAATGH
jgi:hypothetical protein